MMFYMNILLNVNNNAVLFFSTYGIVETGDVTLTLCIVHAKNPKLIKSIADNNSVILYWRSDDTYIEVKLYVKTIHIITDLIHRNNNYSNISSTITHQDKEQRRVNQLDNKIRFI